MKNNKKFDLLIFIGRFQPFHIEHKRIIERALDIANEVLVLVGSAKKARSVRNPFTFEERRRMIMEAFECPDQFCRLMVKPLYDNTYNDIAWVKQVQTVVNNTILDSINNGGFRVNGLNDAKVGLIGAAKDHTSYYLKLFPHFSSVDVPIMRELNATAIREGYISGSMKKHEIIDNEIPKNVAKFLYDDFINREEYQQLRKELIFVKNYVNQWKSAPYPVKHVTVDAVVEQSGHILLVRRRAEPGKGLWALPGGHLNEHERIGDGIIRELYEETKIKVPPAVMRGSIVDIKTFDDPHRSTIGRVITHAAHIKLANATSLPKVKGSDDADRAEWVPISELEESLLFDDHYHIINFFMGT